MIRAHLLFLLLFFAHYLGAQVEDPEPADEIPFTTTNLQGLWKRQNGIFYTPNGDAEYETLEKYGHLYFEGDKLYDLEYPAKVNSVSKFRIDSGAVEREMIRSYNPSKRSGAALLHDFSPYAKVYKAYMAPDSSYMCLWGDCYERVSIDMVTFEKIRNGKFNSEAFIGTWYLRKQYDSGYDGLGICDFDYPITMPDKLVITKAGIVRFWDGNYFYLKIDGVKQRFVIDAFHPEEGILDLSPASWYKRGSDDYFKWNSAHYVLELEDFWWAY